MSSYRSIEHEQLQAENEANREHDDELANVIVRGEMKALEVKISLGGYIYLHQIKLTLPTFTLDRIPEIRTKMVLKDGSSNMRPQLFLHR